MELKSIYEIFGTLRSDNLSFLYHGFFSDEFTEKIISINEFNIEKTQDLSSLKSKVSFLVTESFQNIIKHGDFIDSSESLKIKTGIFITRNIGNKYYISSANLIKKKDIPIITDKILHINELSKEGLRELYIHILDNVGFNEKGGAGLGLIEMARKSNHKLEYDFETIDNEFSFFYLQINLQTKSITKIEESEGPIPLTSAKSMHALMARNNIFMVYKGDFSQDTIIPILRIIERNLQVNQFEHLTVKRMIFHLLTELLQNVSKHGKFINNKRDGIFLIGKYKKNYIISTGNYIDNTHINGLKDNLDLLNQKNKDELKKMYLDKLRDGTINKEGCAGIGLIDIALGSTEKLLYDFSLVDDEISFVTISVKY